MARRDTAKLAQLAAVRTVLRLRAEADVAAVEAEVRASAMARETSVAALDAAAAEWRAGVASPVGPSVWLAPLAARVVARDADCRRALLAVEDAEAEREQRAAALRLAEASERVAARAHAGARRAEARRRDERRMSDRPSGSVAW